MARHVTGHSVFFDVTWLATQNEKCEQDATNLNVASWPPAGNAAHAKAPLHKRANVCIYLLGGRSSHCGRAYWYEGASVWRPAAIDFDTQSSTRNVFLNLQDGAHLERRCQAGRRLKPTGMKPRG